MNYRGSEFSSVKYNMNIGGHRSSTPRETLRKVEPYLTKIGVTRLANITGLDQLDIPVVGAYRANAKSMVAASGKGIDVDSALVSGAMEAIEIQVAEDAKLNVIKASYEELNDNYNMPSLEKFTRMKNTHICPHVPYKWALGWDIIQQCEVPVPIRNLLMVGNDFYDPFLSGSNGLASGSVFIEAVASGLYEVIERDAVACAVVGENLFKRPIKRFHGSQFSYPTGSILIERIVKKGVVPMVWDVTNDIGIPAYICKLLDREKPEMGIYKGYAAHSDPEVAFIRAVNEAAQARCIFIAGARDDMFKSEFITLKSASFDVVETEINNISTKNPELRPDLSQPTFEEDIALILELLQNAGLNHVIVVDLSPEDFPVSVIRVVVPGLEGYMFSHYQPGKRALRH